MEHIFLTGASSGIGLAIVKQLMNKNYIIHTLVRKDEDRDMLQNISKDILVYQCDLTDYPGIKQQIVKFKENLRNQSLYALINNAGIAVAGPLELIELSDMKRQFEINVFATLNITQKLLPFLDSRESKIINISSKSGKIAFPFTGAYAASKHALEAISDSMRRELLNTNIKIIIVEPGAVNTPIWAKAENINLEPFSKSRYASILPRIKSEVVKGGKNGADVTDLAKLINKIILLKKPKIRYTFSKNKFKEIILPMLLPDKILDAIIKKKLFS
jgi:short-subunit dehydrogenase